MNAWNFSSIIVATSEFRTEMYGPVGSCKTTYIKHGTTDLSKPAKGFFGFLRKKKTFNGINNNSLFHI